MVTRTQNAALVAAITAAMSGVLATNGTKKAKGRKGRGRSNGRVKLSDEQKQQNAAKNAAEAEELFKAKGYTDCRANETIKTYKKWIESGRKVKAGEKSLKTSAGYPLFHLAQTEPVEAVEQTAAAPSTETVQ